MNSERLKTINTHLSYVGQARQTWKESVSKQSTSYPPETAHTEFVRQVKTLVEYLKAEAVYIASDIVHVLSAEGTVPVAPGMVVQLAKVILSFNEMLSELIEQEKIGVYTFPNTSSDFILTLIELMEDQKKVTKS